MSKFDKAFLESGYSKLPKKTLKFLKEKSTSYRYSFQEIRQLLDMAIDFHMWNEGGFEEFWEDLDKKSSFEKIKKIWLSKKNSPRSYHLSANNYEPNRVSQISLEQNSLGLGWCPVASTKTRCCNLLTLDAVQSCGYDCSYCAVQSFYHEGKVIFDKNFSKNLKKIKLDPDKIYHIGTGQSSDSLMWGNKEGILDALFDFAKANPNVILELKTKSDNISYMLENDIPPNVISTWSLNPQVVIDNEEHKTVNLAKRIKAAKKIANEGRLVGFHFHPMVLHEKWRENYLNIANTLLGEFNPKSVAMISFGALTFTKNVVKKLRRRALKSKILQMPLEGIGGKFSYTLEQKEEMFGFLYEAFKPWYEDVFFYLCMEDESLWTKVFGHEYRDNLEFEEAMLGAYMKKIGSLK